MQSYTVLNFRQLFKKISGTVWTASVHILQNSPMKIILPLNATQLIYLRKLLLKNEGSLFP